MKAAVLVELNKPLKILDIEISELKIGQVLVRILTSGICGSQLHEIKGFKGNGKFLPHLMGHEGCGIVEEIGPGVTKVKIGDKVVMHWRKGDGIESDFPIYLMEGREFSSGKINTLCEKSIVSENRLTVIGKNVDNELAALLGCSLTTSFAILDNQSDLKFGENVLITGCGGIGLNLILASKLKGAGKIIGVDNSNVKESLAMFQGASSFYRNVAEVNDRINLAIDTTGNNKVISEIYEKLADNGRMILVGQPEPGTALQFPSGIKFFNGAGIKLRATQGGDSMPNDDIPRYIEFFQNREITTKNLVTHRYSLDEINTAFDNLRSGQAGRIIINLVSSLE